MEFGELIRAEQEYNTAAFNLQHAPKGRKYIEEDTQRVYEEAKAEYKSRLKETIDQLQRILSTLK